MRPERVRGFRLHEPFGPTVAREASPLGDRPFLQHLKGLYHRRIYFANSEFNPRQSAPARTTVPDQ